MSISRVEALDSFRSDDLIGLGLEADSVRRRLHPEGVVTYAVDCVLRLAGDASGLPAQAAAMLDRGASGVRLFGTSESSLDAWLGAVRELRRPLPQLWIAGPDAAALAALAHTTGSGLQDTLARLRDAGMDTLATTGVDLADLHPEALRTWIDVHREAHRAGISTTAAVVFGAGQSPSHLIDALEAIRALQEEIGGFCAFIPEPAAGGLAGPTAVESLKTLAIARLVLDSVPNVEFSLAYGAKVLEVGLRFGANDAGALTVSPGAAPDLREEDLRRIARDAGFVPVERDPGYRTVFIA